MIRRKGSKRVSEETAITDTVTAIAADPGHASVLAQLPAMVIITDLTGNIVSWNDAAKDQLGYTTDETMGRHISFLGPDIVNTPYTPGSEQREIIVMNTRDGRQKNLLPSMSLLNDAGGTPIGIIYVLTDLPGEVRKGIDFDQLTKIISCSPDIVCLIDSEYHCRTAGRAFLDTFHVKMEDVVDCHLADILGKKYFGRFKTSLDNALRGYACSYRCWMDTPGFGLRYILTIYSPFKDTTEGAHNVLVSMRDITEQKLTEQELIRSEKQLHNVQRIAHLGTWEYDIRTGKMELSDEIYGMYGIDPGPDDDVVEVLHSCIHPDEREYVRIAREGTIREGRPFNVEYRILRPSGELRYLQSNAEVVFNPKKEPMKVIGTILDITDRKLQALEVEQYKHIVDTTADYIAHLDRNYVYRAVNHQYTVAFRKSREELIGLSCGVLFGKDTFENNIKPLIDRTLTGELETARGWILLPGYGRRYLETRYYPYRDEDGDIIGAVINARDITDTYQVQMELERSEAQLRATQRITRTGSWELDLDSGDIRWSRQTYEIFGLNPERPIDRDIVIGLVHPEDRQRHEEMSQNIFTGDGKFDLEYRIVRPDGVIRHVHGRGAVESDEPMKYVGSVVDITERKLAEEALKRRDAQLREAQRIARLGFWEVDLLQDTIYLSDELCDIYGLEEDENEYKKPDIVEMIHPDDRESFESARNAALEGGGPFIAECRIVRPNGEIVHILNQGEIIRDYNGVPVKVFGTDMDITERKQAELALRKSEELLSRYFNAGLLGMGITTPDRRWIQVNQTFCDMVGYSEEELLEMTWEDLTYDEDMGLSNQQYNKTISDETEGLSFDKRYVRKDGQIIDVTLSIICARKEDGSPDYYVVFVQDITQRKTTEQELAKYRSSLEELVVERTEKLKVAQRELIQKEKLAVLGQLTATVSHELRNPLGTIRSSIYLIGDKVRDIGDDNMNKAIDRVDRNISRCDNIIEELLDYTRLHRLELEELKIDAWLHHLLEDYQLPDDVVLERELTSGVIVAFEKERLYRCVVNIIANACQAMLEDTDRNNEINRITVKTLSNEDRLEIHFVDNGPGIREENLAKIFEPLYSTKVYGVGLGLSIVKQIMEQHGGGIEVYSPNGEGARVTLWLPLQQREIAESAA